MKYIITTIVLTTAYLALAGLKQPGGKPRPEKRICIYTIREGENGKTEKIPMSCGYPENVKCVLVGEKLKCYWKGRIA